MNAAEIQKLVDEVSQTLVMTDPEALGDFECLPEKFGDLAAILMEMDLDEGATACRSSVQVASKMISGEMDWTQGLAVLVQTCDALPPYISGDCPAQEAGFPQEVMVENTEPTEPEAIEPDQADSLVDDDIIEEFLGRQADVLADVEEMLLGLENNGTEDELDWLLRFFHNLKGESALLSLDDVATVCHAAEDLIQATPMVECVDRLLEVKDWFNKYFHHYSGQGSAPCPVQEILNLIAESTEIPPKNKVETPIEIPKEPTESVDPNESNSLNGDSELIHDFLEEAAEQMAAAESNLKVIASNPESGQALNGLFRAFFTIKGLAGFIDLDQVKKLARKTEAFLGKARNGELDLVDSNITLLVESLEMMKRLIAGVKEANNGDGDLPAQSDYPGLISRLMDATKNPILVEHSPKESSPSKDPISSVKAAAKVETIIPAEASSSQKPKTNPSVKMKDSVRVEATRLDHLVETIGEMVIAESVVSQSKELRRAEISAQLAKNLDHLDKICRELQEIGLSLRMVPVRPVFQKMARLVRDLSKKQNRLVDFVMVGEDTELDKTLVDKIGDPLVHMLRNAVDHGMESDPEDRVKNGKSKQGRIELRASHKGGSILLEIEDDGRGMDKEVILNKAISRGLVRKGETLGERDIFNLIFEPGFSTADQITEVSGRGVGMDVVQKIIGDLRGSIDVSSEVGKGTVFSIRLPLTMAIIEGMVVKVGQEHYIIPTLSVVRLVRPTDQDISNVFDKEEMLDFEGQHLPILRLGSLFNVADAQVDPQQAIVVVVENDGRQMGIMADGVLGQQSIVIKSLGESVQGTEGLAGGAIMGNGKVALILDISGLVRQANHCDTISMKTKNPLKTKNNEQEPVKI